MGLNFHECSPDRYFNNKKVVLLRSPCYAPGELLLVTSVDPYALSERAATVEDRLAAREWYSLLQSVTVLSVQGPEDGVASKMQGGDYVSRPHKRPPPPTTQLSRG